MDLSVVIICRNESAVIAETIRWALLLTPDIIIVDTGSTDGTKELLQTFPVKIIHSDWMGFGPTKNIGIGYARTGWILSLDADERVDAELVKSIKAIDFENKEIVYSIQFLNYLGNKPLRFGEWGNDRHLRLFHKEQVHWNDATVHENLVFEVPVTIQKLKGYIHHKTSPDIRSLRTKMEGYAKGMAGYYFEKGKKHAYLRVVFSPLFNFIRNYIFKLGFLDGTTGLAVALVNAQYTYKKYLYLHRLNKNK